MLPFPWGLAMSKNTGGGMTRDIVWMISIKNVVRFANSHAACKSSNKNQGRPCDLRDCTKNPSTVHIRCCLEFLFWCPKFEITNFVLIFVFFPVIIKMWYGFCQLMPKVWFWFLRTFLLLLFFYEGLFQTNRFAFVFLRAQICDFFLKKKCNFFFAKFGRKHKIFGFLPSRCVDGVWLVGCGWCWWCWCV